MIGPTSLENVCRLTYTKNAYSAAKTAYQQPAQESAAPTASDCICISAEGSLQQAAARATAAAGTIPTASSDRLHALREQIQAGTYHVSSSDIAASMLSRSAVFSVEA